MSDNGELLIELLSGEIPAMMQQKAARAYKDIFNKYFLDNSIKFEQINIYVGPRRLTIHVVGLAKKLPPTITELKGPKVTANLDAISGFCRSKNISLNDLTRTEIKGSEFYIYKQETPEKNTKDILLKSLYKPISEYVWPKSMYWGNYKIKWVRPLDNILCIFDGEIIAFNYGHLTANNLCYGHRFMSPDMHKISNFAEYMKILKDNFVMLDANDRKKYIQNELTKQSKALGLVVKEDEKLLEEVVGLVEYPQILLGKIDKRFLSVPSQILVSAMRSHQKYFSLFDQDGNFAPYFLFVSNIASTDVDTVIAGNEKVLSARLADALYFYNQDLKTSLHKKSENLEKVIFHAKLGSLKDKTKRLAEIVKFIDPNNNNAAKAALLCKSDIVSEVVDEFPTLQGMMGYYYAKHESLDNELAVAIRDHYKPQGPSDHCPTGAAATLALADKIDSFCGLMLAGERASGSKDPFALRRQALGIIRIILENNLSLDLQNLVNFVSDQYKDKLIVDEESKKQIDESRAQIILFLEERLKYFFKEKYSNNLIASLLDLNKESSLVEIKNKLETLNEFLSTEQGDDLLTSYKRANNIIEKAKIEKTNLKDNTNNDIDQSLLISEHEIKLFSAIKHCNEKITEIINIKNYKETLELLASMRGVITGFFDNVMVKDKDPLITNNRMLLLTQIKQIFNKIANFDKF